jgi:hypothetical protein
MKPILTHFHQYLPLFFKYFSPLKNLWCKKSTVPQPLGIRHPGDWTKGGGIHIRLLFKSPGGGGV